MNGRVIEMKKRALRKDFTMEIRKTLNRFLSILFIVAMGVAFFSGIQSAAPDMRYTGDAYFDRQNLMDLRVIGTLGITQDDLEALEEIEGVSLVEPGYMTDVLCGDQDSKLVLHVESLLPTMNQVTVTEGTLPQQPDECLMDEEFAANHGYRVGDTVKIREDVEDTSDRVLKKKKLTITGLGNSPAYISLNRGSTTLGTGEVAGFLYVSKQAFSTEVYTQAWIRVEGAEGEQAYAESYENLVDEVMERVEAIEEARCQARLQEVQSEAGEELEEARRELEEGKQESDQKLADAKAQIQDGKKQLKEAKTQLEEGKEALEEAKAQLSAKEQELADAKAQTADGETKLASGKQELAAKEAQFQTTSAQAEKTLADGEKALKEGKKELAAGKKEYEAGLAQYQSGQKEYEKNLASYEKNRKEYEQGLAQYEQGEAEYSQGVKAYEAQKAQYDSAIAAGMPQDDPKMQEAAQQLAAAKQQLSASRAVLDATKQQLQEAKTQLDGAKPQLDEAKKQLDATGKEMEKAKKKLDASEKTIQEKEAQLTAGRKELEEGRQALEAAKSEIAAQEANLASAKQQILNGESQIAEGWETLKEEEQKLNDGEAEIQENETKLADARKEYREGKQEAKEEIADGEAKIADAQKEIDELETPEWYVTDRTSLPEYSSYGENADRIKNIGEVFPVLFFLVAALISLTTMTRMVEEERIQIGTLKALGYGKASIAGKYLCYAFLATLGGSVLGVLVGEKILPFIIIRAYGIIYHDMGGMQLPYNMEYALIAAAASLLCTLGATLASCWRALSETPASLMRPPAPKQGKRVLMERIPILWDRLNFTWKSTFRNLFRYKKRFLMTIFGIGGCMALILVGYGLQDSIMDIAVLQYQQIQNYDSLVVMKEDAKEEQMQELEEALTQEEHLESQTRIYMKKLNLYQGKKEVGVYLMVPQEQEEFADYVTFRDRTTREAYELREDGVILTEKTAKLLDVTVGDRLDLAQNGEESKEVTVAAICENYLGHYAYMSPSLYRKVYGEDADYRTLMIKMKEGTTQEQAQQVGEMALSHTASLSISYTEALKSQLDDMLTSLDTVIVVLIVSAGMLAFVVLYNLNNININERKRELATLKVLGFYDMEVGNYVYRENVLLTLIGALLGAGLGVLLHRFVIVTVEVDACMFGRNVNLSSFVYAALFTLAFSVIVNAAMFFKLKKIDMVESLKSVE